MSHSGESHCSTGSRRRPGTRGPWGWAALGLLSLGLLVAYSSKPGVAGGPARIQINSDGYVAGAPIAITGSGFAIGENVNLTVKHDDDTAEPGMGHETWTVIATDGTFQTTWAVSPADSQNAFFVATAVGGTTGASDTARFGRMAVIDTDKFDYAPGETALIVGSGFRAGESVTLQVVHTDGNADGGAGHDPWTVTADANGQVSTNWFVNPDDSLGASFMLKARGAQSNLHARSAFIDATCPPAPAPDPVVPYALPGAACPIGLNSCTANDVVTTVVAATPLNGDVCGSRTDTLTLQFTLKFDPTANKRYDLGVFVSGDGGTLNNGSGNTPPTAHACIGAAPQPGWGDSNADTGDCDTDLFLDLDPLGHSNTDPTLDTCGDLQPTAGNVYWTVTATVSCATVDDQLHLKVPSCRVWENNANHKDACTSLAQASTGSKCDCSELDFTNVLNPCVTALCDDDNACTADSCAVEGGVAVCHHDNVSNGTSCSDGNACTTGDICVDGQCAPGGTLSCDDGNSCTNDACNPATGCTHTNNNNPCSDGDACTSGDFCQNGSCQPGSGATSCDDGNPCTDDSCDAIAGCLHTNNTAACDDGNACTTGDTCSGGSCHGGAPLVCNDGNGCTDDTCNPASGCVYTNNTAACNDGNACTTGDTCSGGSCHGGAPLTCNDNNTCTDDSCNPTSGCVYTPAPGRSCSDGNACTTNDTCSATGTCVAGPPPNCNDGNPCTSDSCDPSSGCTHTTTGDGQNGSCEAVTDTMYCPLAQACGLDTFRLLDLQNPTVNGSGSLVQNDYLMNASNPGQWYYNVFYSGTPGSSFNLTIDLPWPFITQGANAIQVHDGTGLSAGCFVPNPSLPGFTITTDGGNVSTSGSPVVLLSDYKMQNTGNTTAVYVSGLVPSTGLAYVTIHLDYGLKKISGWQQATDLTTAQGPDTNLDGTLDGLGDGPIYIKGGTCSNGQDYTFDFSSGGSPIASTIYSTNTFKKNPGVNGMLTRVNESPKPGVSVEFWGPTGKKIATTTTDADGFYMFAYKHTGKAATYTIKVPSLGLQKTATLKANGYALVTFDSLP